MTRSDFCSRQASSWVCPRWHLTCPLHPSPHLERESNRWRSHEGGHSMPRGQKFKAEEIIAKLREAEVELARGKQIPEVCKQIGVTEQTYYRWKKEYGGLRIDQAKRLKELEKENARLKRLLADAELDKAILKEAASGNF